MKKEIERKFLLKDLPPVIHNLTEIQRIIQYYYLVGDLWYRIRKISSDERENKYLHTIKTYKDDICYEEERFFTYDEYKSLLADIHSGKYESSVISKTRYISSTGIIANFEGVDREIKWEIDVFDFNLVIAEIELPDMKFEIYVPSFILKKLIYEVTSIKEFSNRSLSEQLKLELNIA